MKDITQMEQEFLAYEQKIQRLQQLGKELAALNTKGFESEATAIKSKLKETTKVDEIETDITTLKNKIQETKKKEQKRNEALNAVNSLKHEYELSKEVSALISSVESEILGLKKSGVKTPKYNEFIELAKAELSKNNFEKAKELANEARRIALETQESYEAAFDSISSTTDAINAAKNAEIDVSEAEGMLNNAQQLLVEGEYEDAFEFSDHAEDAVIRQKKTHESYVEASNVITSIESEILGLKNSGVKTPKYDELIEQAKAELSKNNFEKAEALANEASRIALKRKEWYNLSSDSLAAAERVFNETILKGVVISSGILAKTKQAFDTGDYEEAKKISEELQDVMNTTAKKYSEA